MPRPHAIRANGRSKEYARALRLQAVRLKGGVGMTGVARELSRFDDDLFDNGMRGHLNRK